MICNICNSEDVSRAGTELTLYECDGCGNFLSPQEITELKGETYTEYIQRTKIASNIEEATTLPRM